jgi:hypothetical protein
MGMVSRHLGLDKISDSLMTLKMVAVHKSYTKNIAGGLLTKFVHAQ